MVNQDRLILETYERKNELESLIYRWKANLAGSHQEYSRPEETSDILAFLEKENEWLYNDGQNSNRGTYNDRINGIKNKVSVVAKRHDNFQLLVQEVNNLGDALANSTNLLNSLVNHTLFRTKNTSTLRLKNARKDFHLSTRYEGGFLLQMRSKGPSLSGRTL